MATSDEVDAIPTKTLLEESREVLDDWERKDQSTWRAIDLAPHLLPPDEDEGPDLLLREDGLGLLYTGRRNELHGAYESGKSWIACLAGLEVIRGGRVVAWIDFEDSPRSVAGRMLALGASEAELLERFRYISPAEPLTSARELDLRLELFGTSLVVIDAANEAMALAGLDPNVNRDVAVWYSTLPRLALDAGSTPLVLDHVAKDPGVRRGAVGAGHKQGAISGTSLLVEVATPFGRGSTGLVRLRLEKDRPGYIRGRYPGHRPVVAEVHFDATNPAALVLDVRAPIETAGEWRPTHLMESVSRYLESATEPRSKKDIAQNVHGKNEYKQIGLDLLVADGYVSREDGPRNSVLHVSLKPFREEER